MRYGSPSGEVRQLEALRAELNANGPSALTFLDKSATADPFEDVGILSPRGVSPMGEQFPMVFRKNRVSDGSKVT